MSVAGMVEEQLAEQALAAARDTRYLRIGPGARHDAAAVFQKLFGSAEAMLVADPNTFAAAGGDVEDSFRRAGHALKEPFFFDLDVYAEYSFLEKLRNTLRAGDAIPVAVGSGTINDLTKRAAHELGRPYMVVATAASMDGYTAYGASITCDGSKQTLDCPAPLAVVADLETIAGAPAGMNASGYADLLAKCPAGADWILADALGIEPVQGDVWRTVQARLRAWLEDPGGIRRADPECLRRLTYGLMLSGFAMQAMQSSRPASGADHQFSHLWDMQHHIHEGAAPSHGFKVGIGSLSSVALYEFLLAQDPDRFDPERALRQWPSLEKLTAEIDTLFESGDGSATARREMPLKYESAEAVARQIARVRDGWAGLRARLREHLFSFAEMRQMLREAGCAYEPEQIGISRERLRRSYRQAYFIRRRFTVLDLAERAGLAEEAMAHIFGPEGPWGRDYGI